MSMFPEPQSLPSDPSATAALIRTMAAAFLNSDDPMEHYLTAAELHLSNTATLTLPQVISNITPSIEKSIAQKAKVLVISKKSQTEEAQEFAAAAIWFTPTHPRGPRAVTPESTKPFLEYHYQSEEVKHRVLADRKYYYVHIVVRAPGDQTKGAVSALMKWGIEKAREEDLPVYLEATNRHARDVYEHFGFRVVGEIVVGKGEVDEGGFWVEGEEKKSAPGVTCWAMVLEPDS